MKTVYLALDDLCLCDQIKAGMRIFTDFRAVVVPKHQVNDLLRQDTSVDALIMDCDGSTGDNADALTKARELRPDLFLLGVGERSQRERLHRLKLQLNIFSFIPLPLDPFDLLRRLARLSEAFKQPISRS